MTDDTTAGQQEGVTAQEFKAVFRRHPAGVAVVTAVGAQGPIGFTATSVISLSVDPPFLAFSVNAGSSSRATVETAETVVVNFLSAQQAAVATRFAAPAQDRFAGLERLVLADGDVVLSGSAAWARGRIEQRVEVGNSLLVVARVLQTGMGPGSQPLVYVDGAYHTLSEASRLV